MSSFQVQQVSIVGAGLAGLTLALALHQQAIPVTVYEARPEPLNIGGAVMLSPNALKILDALGLYDTIKSKGFNFDTLEYRNLAGDIIDTQEFGSEAKYGYRGLRIYRHVLISELVSALQKQNIEVVYGKKFSHVTEESSDSTIFAFQDGTTVTTSLLVGADGIHSTVRKYMYPDLQTKFIGMAGITAAVPASQVKLPEGYHLPVTVVSPQGAFVMAQQRVDGSEIFFGKQMRVTPGDKPDWDRDFVADKDSALEFLQQNNDHFPEFVKNVTAHIDKATINKWPFFVVPKLDRWASELRRVVIVGDAAHAIPPSAGQGINQAFEDVYMLALVLGQRQKIRSFELALSFWQEYRQTRVDKVLVLNQQIDARRMPSNDAVVGSDSSFKREPFDLSWLYQPDFKRDVQEWVASNSV